MNYKLIAAVCKGGGIGKNNALPWKIKEDLIHFSKLTRGNGNNAVVMGRKTWESLPGGALIGRDNIVLSNTLTLAPGLLLVTIGLLDRLLDCLTIRDLRLLEENLSAVFTLEFLNRDLNMHLPHAGDDHLFGLRIAQEIQSRILLSQL